MAIGEAKHVVEMVEYLILETQTHSNIQNIVPVLKICCGVLNC